MKYILIFIAFINYAFADEIKIRVNPLTPVYNEPFNVEFMVKTENGTDPIINFNPLGLEVLSRSELGTSTRLTYINGKSTVERTITLSYEMMAKRPGGVFLRDIEVELNGSIIKHKTIKIKILRKAKATKKIFVRAELDKKTVFVGESILARYYLYSRADVPLTSMDIRKFPKLNKFLKRFHQEQMVPQRVQVDGKMYIRRIMYTAQLYAEKAGHFPIDPITMKVSYSNRRSGFGNFGFNLNIGRPKTTTIISPKIEVEVLSLPAAGMEPHFSGLVGEHSFQLKINKNKFIANEPIEVSLIVQGMGALELFEAPPLISDPNIEEFEKNTDLTLSKNFLGVKKIDYTYLGRGDVDLKDIKIPISYFDYKSVKYITKYLQIGDIKVAGIGNQFNPNSNQIKPKNTKEPKLAITAPILKQKSYQFKPIKKLANTFLYNLKEICFALLGLCIISLIYFSIKILKSRKPAELTIFEEIYKYGIDYSSLYHAIRIPDTDFTMEEVLDILNLKDENKDYFLNLIKELSRKYASSTESRKISAKKKYFKDLEKALEGYTENKIAAL